MKNYFDIIRNVSNMRWAITDREPTSFAEVQQDVKQAITQAHSYIWSLDDFPFKIRKDALTINKGQTAILAPKGTLLELWIDGSNSYMEQISSKDADFLSAQTVGMPTKYWVDFCAICTKIVQKIHTSKNLFGFFCTSSVNKSDVTMVTLKAFA